MVLASMGALLAQASQGGYALGYFEAWDQYSLEATVEAAERSGSPLIVGFGAAVVSQPWLEKGGLEQLATLARCLAERTSLPAAVLFNEARTFPQVLRALCAGCNAVMMDTSHLPFEDNVALTRQVVEAAHALGATVEAEMGLLPEAGAAAVGRATDPAEAARFVERTGVDALAVSIGNTHLLMDGEAGVDLGLLQRIHAATGVPLVLHGGTGFPSWAVRPAIECGVAKFNVGTRLKQVFLQNLRATLAGLPEQLNVHGAMGSREEADVMHGGQAAMAAQIVALQELYGCAGRASS